MRQSRARFAGQSVDGREYLTCGHVKYSEGPKGSIINKPERGTAEINVSVGYDKDMANEFGTKGLRGTITDEGLEAIIRELERTDKIASDAAKTGTPIYEDVPD